MSRIQWDLKTYIYSTYIVHIGGNVKDTMGPENMYSTYIAHIGGNVKDTMGTENIYII